MVDKIWLKSYPKGVPAEIDPDAYPSLIDIFEQCFSKYQTLPAMRNLGCTLTYQQLDEATKNFAAYLQKTLGLVKGDRFAIMLPNLLQYPIAMIAALRAGLIVVNVNPLYTERELTHQLKDSGAKAIIVLSNFASVLQQSLPHTDLKHVIVTNVGDAFSPLKSWIVNFVVKHIKKMVPAWSIDHAIPFRKVMLAGKHQTFNRITLIGTDIAYLQYTGGTTGVAKGAILTHRNMVANVEQASAWITPVANPTKEIVITALPMYHIFSLTANCLTFLKYGALNVLITNPRDIPGFVKELSKVKFTAITGVNTLFNALLNNPNFAKLDFSALHLTLGGGMSVQKTVAERWHATTGKPLLEAYGLTETAPAVCINPMDLANYNGSIGLPISSTQVLIRDILGKEALNGQPGELCVKGPQVMQGYWQKPIETHHVFTEDGWLLTGDIATMDARGFVYIVDRKKDMILVSGFNVYPNEIEDVIASNPAVLEVAVIGVPSPQSGEQVKAFVVRKNPELTEEQLMTYCRANLTAYKVPKIIEFRTQLPKSNVGKILRRQLRDEEKVHEAATN